MKRGEIWLADLGYVGKVRPVLILGVLEEVVMAQVEEKSRIWLGL